MGAWEARDLIIRIKVQFAGLRGTGLCCCPRTDHFSVRHSHLSPSGRQQAWGPFASGLAHVHASMAPTSSAKKGSHADYSRDAARGGTGRSVLLPGVGRGPHGALREAPRGGGPTAARAGCILPSGREAPEEETLAGAAAAQQTPRPGLHDYSSGRKRTWPAADSARV